jgi:hypothetical protein
MAKNLTIVSVQCIKPSSGVDSLAFTIFAAFDEALGRPPSSSVGTTAGGVLVAAEGGAGVAVIPKIDHVFAGADELCLEVNGAKVYPPKEYVDCNSQQTKQVGYSAPLTRNLAIALWEKDSKNSDDLLGSMSLCSDHKAGNFSYLVTNRNEGSIYKINICVTE